MAHCIYIYDIQIQWYAQKLKPDDRLRQAHDTVAYRFCHHPKAPLAKVSCHTFSELTHKHLQETTSRPQLFWTCQEVLLFLISRQRTPGHVLQVTNSDRLAIPCGIRFLIFAHAHMSLVTTHANTWFEECQRKCGSVAAEIELMHYNELNNSIDGCGPHQSQLGVWNSSPHQLFRLANGKQPSIAFQYGQHSPRHPSQSQCFHKHQSQYWK